MKSLLFFLALSSLASTAAAEWTQIGQDSYVDYEYLSNKKTKNQQLKVWQLKDRQESVAHAAGVPVLSVKFLTEIDCVRRESAITYIVSYSDYMGAGRQLSAADPRVERAPVIPGSLQDVFRKTGCPK
ncbi:MAG: hypothetical protein Q7K13_06190 [Polynucleobacter sp.]|uniref:surface-adhesin E family protein n=1 Tax=Polynucleobacter sp. TaxID=2029855 RepID=UPI002728FCD9|nr:surface-adhesin E family protein [Polynucleobacter sp.]MDO8714052.1 hypothetical protein [Polynucleobacter sp.]